MTTVSIRLDDELKTAYNKICDELGLPMATAFNMFAKAVVRDGALPASVVTTNRTRERRNAEYLAKLEESERQIENGEVFEYIPRGRRSSPYESFVL